MKAMRTTDVLFSDYIPTAHEVDSAQFDPENAETQNTMV